METHGRGQALSNRLDVIRGRRRERQGLLGVETLLANGLGGHLAQRGEVGECPLEAALDPRVRIEMVVGDQRAEVVGGQCDQDGIDELAGSPSAVRRLAGVSRRYLPRPKSAIRAAWCRQEVAELPGHAAEV